MKKILMMALLCLGAESESMVYVALPVGQSLVGKAEHEVYSLMYEEGTLLYRYLEQGKIKEISDELSLDMYNVLIDRLTAAGYEHYEISNFALPGFRSRHNSSYWHDTPYIGVGAAAHSYDGKTRSWNTASLDDYISSIEDGIRPCEYETIDAETVDGYNPLAVIDAMERRSGEFLKRWADEIVEKNIRTVNMLGCHDGIPLLDLKGLLDEDSIGRLIDTVVARGGYVKNLHGQKNVYYQVNATYYSAL